MCLRRRTQRHAVISTLQRCMKHAHSSTHAVCLLLFTRKWGAWPWTACWLALTKEQTNWLSVAIVMGLYLPGELYLLPSSLNVSQIQLSPHTICCKHTPCVHVVYVCELWICVRYSHILILYLSRLNRTHRFANYKQNLKPPPHFQLCCCCSMQLCHLKREKETSAILAQQAVDDWSCDLGI